MILETLVAASIYSGASGPTGLLAPNFLDFTPNDISGSVWESITGTYAIGEYDSTNKIGPETECDPSRHSRKVSIEDDGVYAVWKTNWFPLNLQWATAHARFKYLGSVFHEPYYGWCGSAECSSLIYKMSRAIEVNECSGPLQYIIIAFDVNTQRYSRVFLSSLTGKEIDLEGVAHRYNLDELEWDEFKSTHYIRQEPTTDWIQSVPGKDVCRGLSAGDPDAVLEAKRQNLSPDDCRQVPVSDKGRFNGLETYPGKVFYAKIKKPIQIKVYAENFYRLRPYRGPVTEKPPKTCPEGYKVNKEVKLCTPDISVDDAEVKKLFFRDGLNRYEAKAVSRLLGGELINQLSYHLTAKLEDHYRGKNRDFRKNLTLERTFKAVSVDLNGDEKNEVIVTWTDPFYCGASESCEYILDRSSGNWMLIGQRFGRNSLSFISKKRVNGYSTIHFITRDGRTEECVFKDGEYRGAYC